jgi:hypothetical protein
MGRCEGGDEIGKERITYLNLIEEGMSEDNTLRVVTALGSFFDGNSATDGRVGAEEGSRRGRGERNEEKGCGTACKVPYAEHNSDDTLVIGNNPKVQLSPEAQPSQYPQSPPATNPFCGVFQAN